MQNMFFTHFEIKAFKDLNKTDRYLLVIFNLATFINNYILFKIYYFSFSHSKQLTQTLHTHLRPQYPSQGHSLGYAILPQFSYFPSSRHLHFHFSGLRCRTFWIYVWGCCWLSYWNLTCVNLLGVIPSLPKIRPEN